MNESELKTSTKQRVAIIAIAVVMLGSIIASYVAIVASGGAANSSTDTSISDEKAEEYAAKYAQELSEFQELTAGDFSKFKSSLGAIAAYNEENANNGGVAVRDLLAGNGRELTAGDTNYLAYYAGWCADGTVFDSSLDSEASPSGFTRALNASAGLIEGWNTGVVGMKLGGIRELTIPGEKAYGSSREICGGYNKPLKFLVMAVANEDPLKTAASEIEEAYLKVQYANYGIDYEKM